MKHSPPLQVIEVLFAAEQETGLVADDPPVQVIVVAPAIVRSFAPGSAIGLAQLAVPAGTLIVSPLAAAVTQSFTSVRDALAAVRVGLEPEQAATAGRAHAQTTSAHIAVRHSLVK